MIGLLAALAVATFVALEIATMVAAWIGRAGFPLPDEDRRIGCIDGLRGYLALSVMVHHFFLWVHITRLGGTWGPPTINALNQLGAGGVGLFFMTTGLVFYPRILTGLKATSWTMVYVTRAFRILPLVAVSVGIMIAIIMARTGRVPRLDDLGGAILWTTTLGQPSLLGYPDTGRLNAYVLWSLNYEWLFYLAILPICAALMDIVRARHWPTWAVPVALLAAAIIGRLAVRALHLSFAPIQYLPLFAAGMLAYECQARPAIRARLATPVMGLAAVAALAIGMMATSTPYSLSLPLFGFFFVCVACGNSLNGLLRRRGALILGECSFGIYLCHGLLLDLLFVDLGPAHGTLPTVALPLLLPAVAAVIVLVTAGSYLGIERPAMRAGRSVGRWLAGRRVGIGGREIEVAP